MSGKPYDATFKGLIEEDPRAWAERFTPHPVIDVTIIDADVSTVTAAADKVLRVHQKDGDCLLDIDAEGRYAADAPERLMLYSTLLRHNHKLPVRSVLLLLRPLANASNLTGIVEHHHSPEEEPYHIFRFSAILAEDEAGGEGAAHEVSGCSRSRARSKRFVSRPLRRCTQ